MHASVADAWRAFAEPLDGRVRTMYLDILGFVTCGVGNLIDPVSEAEKLPWRHADGRLATRQEIREAWYRLKTRPDLAQRDVSQAAALTGLVLGDQDVDDLVLRQLAQHERLLVKTLTRFLDYPADAQLGILSMAWAVGPGFTSKFARFTDSAVAEDWQTARAECTIREDKNPGVVPRNAKNRICFANAALVTERGLPRHVLHWPAELA